jgi:hypothetical protein
MIYSQVYNDEGIFGLRKILNLLDNVYLKNRLSPAIKTLSGR